MLDSHTAAAPAFLIAGRTGPPQEASGLPKSIMQTAHRGRGFRQLGHPLNYSLKKNILHLYLLIKKNWRIYAFDFMLGLVVRPRVALFPLLPEKTVTLLPQKLHET